MKVLDVKYVDATAGQLASATARFNKSKGFVKDSDSKLLLKQTLTKDKFEHYPSYDKKGNLTIVGKAKRLTDLKRKGLNENATVGEYLVASFEKFQNDIIKLVNKIKKNYTKTPTK